MVYLPSMQTWLTVFGREAKGKNAGDPALLAAGVLAGARGGARLPAVELNDMPVPRGLRRDGRARRRQHVQGAVHETSRVRRDGATPDRAPSDSQHSAAHPTPLPPHVQCKCVAANYEQTCECSIGECAAQRPQMICNQGCPYWEDSCSALVRSAAPDARRPSPVPAVARGGRSHAEGVRTQHDSPDPSSRPAARSATAWCSKANARSRRRCTCRRRLSSLAPMPRCRRPTGVHCCLPRTRSCYEIR